MTDVIRGRSLARDLHNVGDTTLTFVPVCRSSETLRAATSPPPTTRHGRARTRRNIGRKFMTGRQA
ncbi:MAG: hypothetical protein O7B27_10830 [Gammaproteobacteria bacterium]|nr:hypothetical protein [Gammaproteobacteria bacterium]